MSPVPVTYKVAHVKVNYNFVDSIETVKKFVSRLQSDLYVDLKHMTAKLSPSAL